MNGAFLFLVGGRLHFTIEEFINIIKSNDNRKYSSLKTKTLQIMEILTTCRYESGLIFDKDPKLQYQVVHFLK